MSIRLASRVQVLAHRSLRAALALAIGVAGLTVVAGPAAAVNDTSKFAVTGITSAIAAGASQSITVTAQNASGVTDLLYRGTVHLQSDDSTATLPADYSFTPGDNGTHTFTGVKLNAPGSWSIAVNDTATPTITGSLDAITVYPGLSLSSSPSPVVAGQPSVVTATALKGDGTPYSGYRGTLHFASTDSIATLPSNYTFVSGDNGTHVFSGVLFRTIGSPTLSATDTDSNRAPVTTKEITVAVSPILTVRSITSPVTAGVASNVVVEARDTVDNLDSSYRGTVHFTSTDAAATLPADYTFNIADGGAHTFSNGVTLRTAGSRAVTATDATNLTAGTQSGITVNPAGAASLLVTGPSAATSGSPITISVTAKDAFSNTATGYAGTVRFTSSDSQATLPANSTLTAGVGTFPVTLRAAATSSVTGTDTVTSSISGTKTGIVVSPATATTLFVTVPSTSTAGTAGDVTVTARDASSNTATGYRGTVHFTSTDGRIDSTSGLPANYTFTAGDNGTHTFASGVTFKTAGNQTVSATDLVAETITGTSAVSTVSPGALNRYTISGLNDPSDAVAGTGYSMTVAASDLYGNVRTDYAGTVHFTSTDAQAVLPADYTFVPGDAGSHQFTGVVLKTVGSRTVTATEGGLLPSGITGSKTVNVISGSASLFLVTGIGTPTSVGDNHSVTVEARDAYGNRADRYSGIVRFTSTDSGATLPANYTFTTGTGGDNGIHTFAFGAGTNGVSFATAGNPQSVTATDTLASSVTGLQAVDVRAATHHLVVTMTGPLTAGTPASVTVTAVDAAESTTSLYRGTIHFTSSDTQATTGSGLPADYTFVAGDNGTHTFSSAVTLKTAGTQTVTATDTVRSTISGAKSIVVNAASTAALAVSGVPSRTLTGAVTSVTVSATDAFGNATPGYTGRVRFTSSDAAATRPVDYTFVAGDNGTHSFTNQLTLRSIGTQSVTATDTVSSSITGAQTGITVVPILTITGPSTGSTGPSNSYTFTVKATDSLGNTGSGYRGQVAVTTDDLGAIVPANYTFVAGDAGSHQFSVTFADPGSKTITVSEVGNPSVTASKTITVVGSGSAVALQLSTISSPRTAGTASSLTVSAIDVNGFTATTYTGTVGLTSTDSQATLPSSYTFLPGDNGTHTFTGVVLKTVGSQTVTATDGATPSITGTTDTVTVNAGAPALLAVSGIPDPVNAGAPASVTVRATDPYGNTTSGYRGTIAFATGDAQGTVPSNYTFTFADSGTHTFTGGVTLKTSGVQRVTATDTTTSSIIGSQSLTVTAGPIVNLTMSALASPRLAGAPGSVTVTGRDQYSNAASGYRGTLHFTSSDSQTTAGSGLPADYTFTAGDAGSHTFTDGVILKTAGTQSVTVTDTVTSALTAAQTGITVNPGPTAVLSVTGVSSPRTAGSTGSVTVTAKDAYNNLTTGYLGTVAFTSSDSQATLPANYTFLAGDSGTHSFTNGVTLKTAGTRTVSATDTTTSSITGTQSGITVNPGSAITLSVTGIANPATAGQASTAVVTAKDAYNNAATGYLGTVTFTSSDSQATLPANYTFLAGDSGTHSFTNGVTLKTAGTRTVSATDTTTSSITGTQSGITVNPGSATKLTVGGISSPRLTNVGSSVSVAALDAYNNLATGYRGRVVFSSSDPRVSPGAGLPASYAFAAGDGGTHTFTNGVTLKSPGTQSVTATDTVTSSIAGTQGGIVVNPTSITGYELDGFGGLHAFGGAPPATGGPYWSGWDIARALALRSNGTSGYVLDGFGGIHPFGGAPAISGAPYFGFDIARDLVLVSDTSGYVLDGWGGTHAFGGAPPMTGGPYFRGFDIARAFVVSAPGKGYVLDGWGGKHSVGGAPALTGGPYWSGRDIARSIVLRSNGTSGYVLDGLGGTHAFGGAPSATSAFYDPATARARNFILTAGAGTGGYVLDARGGLSPFGGTPAIARPATFGFDIARDVAARTS